MSVQSNDIMLLFILMVLPPIIKPEILNIDLNSSSKIHFPHFWKSTGLCPPDPKDKIYQFLSSKDVKINIALIGALPNNGIELVRVHWLLYLLSKNSSTYDFTHLDRFLDLIVGNRLSPGFEIMGFPINAERNVTYSFWKNLTYQIAKSYTNKYGIKNVKKWRFETWNEPDLKSYNVLNFTLDAYLNYIKGVADGLHQVFKENVKLTGEENSVLKFGGPAGLFKNKSNHPLCWGILEHCSNHIKDCPLQFLSFHKKGDGFVEIILEEELALLENIYLTYPKLKALPISNDESDILVNWSKSEEWRADVRYGAMVAKTVIRHFVQIILQRNISIEAISFDNAFLNYYPHFFSQRTLFARFQMNNTVPPHSQFIKKPVYITMGLMSLLESVYLQHGQVELCDVVATISPNSLIVAVLITCSNNTQKTDHKTKLNLNIGKFGNSSWTDVVYSQDNEVSNPFLKWDNFGRPVYPTIDNFKEIRKIEGPYRLKGPALVPGALQLELLVLVPSVTLIHICSKMIKKPGRVTELQLLNLTRGQVLLIWKDTTVQSKCILTYEIEVLEFCIGVNTDNGFKRINPQDTIFLSYHHVATGSASCGGDPASGRYRVRAVDYWKRKGKYSKSIKYP